MKVAILKRVGGLIAVAAVAAACSTTDSGRKQLTLMSDSQLELQAKETFEQMRANMPLVKDQKTIDYVACVANALVAEMDGDAANMYWELAIFDQPTENAMVMPGGKISVFAGILKLTKNQDQLATVLGHEMAHATARHTNERATRAAMTDAVVEWGALVFGSGGYYDPSRGIYRRGTTQSIYGMGKALEDIGINRPFSRLHEAEADEIGSMYMARAGFDPRESVKLWKNMSDSNNTKIPEMMSTHPSDESRLEAHVEHLPEALAIYNEARANGRNPQCER
jgi:predicted Zn-dependent protease